MRVLVVGQGRLGASVARGLASSGVTVTRWRGRGRWPTTPPEVDVVLVAVGDPFLGATAERLAARLGRRVPVLHASGARDESVLAALRPRPIGVMHPLVSFAGPTSRAAAGVAVIAGDRAAVRAGRALARALGLAPIEAPIHGPRYHAAAALVANGSAALAHAAVRSLVQTGLSKEHAEAAVAGLLRSVADNVARVGVPAALTGPIVRGDAATVAAHRAALDRSTRAAYDAIAPAILTAAIDAGLAPAPARAIRAALTRAGNTRRSRAR